MKPLVAQPTPDMPVSLDYNKIYEPSEDTFLLLDALESDLTFLKERNPRVALEIGSGSGCAITFLGKIIYPQPLVCMATDINPYATKATLDTSRHNGVMVDSILTSLTEGICLDGVVDILLFNPPYVPSEENIVDPILDGSYSDQDVFRLHSASWAGGLNGRYWIDKLMPRLSRILSPKGCLVMIVLEQNRPEELMRWAKEQWNMDSKVLLDKRTGLEHLYAIRFSKCH